MVKKKEVLKPRGTKTATTRKRSSTKNAASSTKKSQTAKQKSPVVSKRRAVTSTKKKATKNVPPKRTEVLAADMLRNHFGDITMSDIVTASRKFPPTTRADLQLAIEEVFSDRFKSDAIGLYQHYSYGTTSFSSMLDTTRNPTFIGPLQYDEIDTGEAEPIRCLKNSLWLGTENGVPFSVVLANSDRRMEEGTVLEIGIPAGAAGLELSRAFLKVIEELVARSSSYRGKVISLEQASRYSGESGDIRVHKLKSVSADEVILPKKTLELLDRNVIDFISRRERLTQLGMPIKKGVLFYGPPGTGKTHTIHYLASQLPDHTTLLITAGQVGLLEEYFILARFMQPAMIVIEDADLIARDRESMNSPCEESLLNRLLNEMDGLRSDAAILFVLTTNRPEHLEHALSSRPGRIDQAIEFPLPDEDGRRKLIRLYSGGLKVSGEIETSIAQRTEGASAAFIKELMRRSAQYLIGEGHSDRLEQKHLNLALDEMLFGGGRLNVRLLGGAAEQED